MANVLHTLRDMLLPGSWGVKTPFPPNSDRVTKPKTNIIREMGGALTRGKKQLNQGLRRLTSPSTLEVKLSNPRQLTTPTPIPTRPVSQNVRSFLKQQIPPAQRGRTTIEEYYPAYSEVAAASAREQERLKLKRLADVAVLASFYEGGLGRGVPKSKNLFGLRYGGTTAHYPSYKESIGDYFNWLSGKRENVYVYPLIKEAEGAVTARDIEKLYGKGYPYRYGPAPSSPGYYLPELLGTFSGGR